MVAIIGVLVAISIPIFSKQLKKARLAVNQAHAKSAEEMAMTEYLTEEKDCTVYFSATATGKQGSYTPSSGTGYSYKNYTGFYVSAYQNISTPIEEWSIDSDMRPKSYGNFKAGDKIAKAWLVTVAYDASKGYGKLDKDGYKFGIVALYDGERIEGTGLSVGK